MFRLFGKKPDRTTAGSLSESHPHQIDQDSLVDAYFTSFLPGLVGKQLIPGLEKVNAWIRFRIEGNQMLHTWDVEIEKGCVTHIQVSGSVEIELGYGVSAGTFLDITGGYLRAEKAFLSGKVRIDGNLLSGLKMAALLQPFFDRYPYHPQIPTQAIYTSPVDPSSGSIRDNLQEFPGIIEEISSLVLEGVPQELRLVYPETTTPTRLALIAPPHPFLGASLDNPLVRYLSLVIASQDICAVRFAYSIQNLSPEQKGISLETFWSTSETVEDLGVGDLLRTWRWGKGLDYLPIREVILVGYSYGCQVVLKGLREMEAHYVILVSPVVSQLGTEIMNAKKPVLLISAPRDFATSPSESEQLFSKLPQGSRWIEIEGADHFYSDHESDLNKPIHQYLQGFPS